MKTLLPIFFLTIFFTSCEKQVQFSEDFNRYQDRIWISDHFWPIPIEEWKIENGRVECIGERANMRLNLLTTKISGEGTFYLSVDMGVTNEYGTDSDAGIRLAIKDETDDDIRSLCYFGKGINVGVNTEGFLFINDATTNLPSDFDLSGFTLEITGNLEGENGTLIVTCIDQAGVTVELAKDGFEDFNGIVSLVQNFPEKGQFNNHPKFYFDNIELNGSNLAETAENAFGPVLFTMYTLDQKTLNLTAQFPPLGAKDNQEALLQVKKNGDWETVATQKIERLARIAPFNVKDWDGTKDQTYRVLYTEKYQDGTTHDFSYVGTIRAEPTGDELIVGGLTGQNYVGYPYRPLVKNLAKSNPDMLFFSGDQIYEGNGGYGIIRFPAERAIENYLGKWYMFGWTFGEVMKDRPTVCIPDDHEVFQGNLWGDGGKILSQEQWSKNRDDISGFVQPVDMVNVVVRTNCSHLPAPYDPTPMKNGILVYYTDLEYGGVDFAIVGDRMFKSGPENVATWKGRNDHLKEPLDDPSVLEKPGLTLLGDRQMKFLDEWTNRWDGKQVKVLLTQTPFTYVSTHHGFERMFLAGDLDSGGWPKSSRDSILRMMDRCKTFHIAGDQHISVMLQYGIDNFRDAGWVFCTPAVAVGYPRRFMPDMLGWKVQNRPAHGLPNTGEYKDGFGNYNYVYAVGNPDDKDKDPNRYTLANLKASGYGLAEFHKADRTVTCESIRFLGDLENPNTAQFPGWPMTINLDSGKVIN